MIKPPTAAQRRPSTIGLLDRLAQQVVRKKLAGLRRGKIIIHDNSRCTEFGNSADLQAMLRVNNPRFFRHVMCGGTLSAAESYFQGDWDCDDLTTLFRIFLRNRSSAGQLDRGLGRLAKRFHRLFHWWHANTERGSRRNISAHYDLGNDFFRLWLDDTMAYSCGIFPRFGASLLEASIEKFDRVCRKLKLQPDDEVLEIGTGWGGFALHAAQQYGCHVTTTTISRDQFCLASQRIQDAGLTDQVMLLQQDYRQLRGQFDKLVSIEMIEAVGYRFLDDYFRQCSRLLRPQGSMLLQAIVMPEQGYRDYLKSVDFIQRYVFPGGCLPSLGAILASVGRVTDLRFLHAEDYSPHYAETLRHWRQAFFARLDDVRRLGFSDRFIRLWDYYLCYCEAAFAERHIGILQIQFDKPECSRDLSDHYRNDGAKWSQPVLPQSVFRAIPERWLCETRGDG